MSYQVLARKWRPRNFHEMVGQEHVLTALVNALDHNRLHHAYLFTGTRGVGKTTIARILAKCLNCETGISSNPCGTCDACTEIAEGRFVDLIEVDAASRTKVEDTRDLLDNVQYAPARGRFKVYLIDEVHMLSGHSFNALLKTLEEPPPHVKFLLATTDPQKLPVTVLSRCLQFHLKNMSQERIVGHLENILGQENFSFEEPALWQLARAADGSMRDALSLTDQAIAYGNGQVNEAEVSAMLGTIDQAFIHNILSALAALNGKQVMAAVAAMSAQSPDYAGALADIIGVLHRVALAQTVPEALDNSLGDKQQVTQLAQNIASEDVQLFYQIALHGRKDLAISPDPRAGFEMTLLRMLAFKPQGVAELPKEPLPQSSEPVVDPSAANSEPAAQPNTVSEPSAEPPQQSEASPLPPVNAAELAAQHNETSLAQTAAVVPSAAKPTEQVAQALAQPATGPASASDNEPPPISSEDEYFSSAPAAIEPAAKVDRQAANIDSADTVIAAPKPQPTPAVSKAEPVIEANSAPGPEPETKAKSLPSAQELLARASQAAQAQVPEATPPAAPEPPAQAEQQLPAIGLDEFSAQNWLDVYPQLNVTGVLQSTVSNSVYTGRQGDELQFDLDQVNASLYSEEHQGRFAEILSQYFNHPVSVNITQTQVDAETPAAKSIRLRAERHAHAVALVRSDPLVQRLVQDFGVELDPEKIEPM